MSISTNKRRDDKIAPMAKGEVASTAAASVLHSRTPLAGAEPNRRVIEKSMSAFCSYANSTRAKVALGLAK